MQRSIVALVASFVTLPAAAFAQSCPPGSLCSSGATCPAVVCSPGALVQSTTVSARTLPLSPPVGISVLSLPCFTPGPNQQLVRAQIDLAAELVNGSIQARNLAATPVGPETFVMQTLVNVQGAFAPLFAPGASLTPASMTFTDMLGATTWPGPPANPCVFGGPDSVTHLNLGGNNGRRACIDDPAVLASVFSSTGGASSVDVTFSMVDTSAHLGSGSLCIVFTNTTRLSATITYFYCQTTSSTGTLTCAADGSQPAGCPCANLGLAAHGCANSASPQGAGLWATGSAAADTVTFFADGLPATALSVLLQGTATLAPGVVFGDGLRCAGGTRAARRRTRSRSSPTDFRRRH